MLRAWHVSDVSADEAVELATRYGFEAASIMVEHNVAHEYAAEMVAS